jgi:TDG/mug DNA glycosylase family protein
MTDRICKTVDLSAVIINTPLATRHFRTAIRFTMPQETLPDYLRGGLAVLSVGLNPSLPSVRAGFYFANPRNRFWRALAGSGLVSEPLVPGMAAMAYLFGEWSIGFTDVVKRPTAGGRDLRAADFREGAPRLRTKIEDNRPLIAWFHGKQAYGNYLRYAGGGSVGRVEWGEQGIRIGASRVFVTPNPSPANAVFSLQDLVGHYAQLKDLRDRLVNPG